MPSVWDPIGAKLFLQPGGPGNVWQFTDVETDVDAIAGGDVTYESDYAEQYEYVGSRQTSNPGDFTGTIMARRYNTASALRELAKGGCYFGTLLVSGCPELDVTQFQGAIALFDTAFTTKLNTTGKMKDSMEGANAKVLDNLPFRAPVLQEWRQLAHMQVPGLLNAAINHVIGINIRRCAGPCGPLNNGSQEYVAVGAAVAPATIPRIYYTADGGVTWKSPTLTGITDATAVRVTRMGDRILIACTGTTGGIWTVSYNTLKDPATTTSIAASLVSGISSGTAINDVLAVKNLIVACGPAGAIYISRNKGYTFSVLNNTATANALTRIAARDDNTIVFGGASGTIVTYLNQTAVSLLVVSGIAGDAVTALAIPKRWTDELYIGTVTGEIWRSRDARITFEQVRFTGDNAGVVDDIQFAGEMGSLMFFIQTDAAPTSRVMVDRSGGAGGDAVDVLGSYTSPTNAGVNSIAPTDVNYAVTVGDVISSLGFIGRVFGN